MWVQITQIGLKGWHWWCHSVSFSLNQLLLCMLKTRVHGSFAAAWKMSFLTLLISSDFWFDNEHMLFCMLTTAISCRHLFLCSWGRAWGNKMKLKRWEYDPLEYSSLWLFCIGYNKNNNYFSDDCINSDSDYFPIRSPLFCYCSLLNDQT